MEDWECSAWSDESLFHPFFLADDQVRAGRRHHEVMNKTYQHGVAQTSGGSEIAWSTFSWTSQGVCLERNDRHFYASHMFF